MTGPRYRVRCEQFSSTPLPSLADARRRLTKIEMTSGCLLHHTIEVEQPDGTWREHTSDE